MEKFERLHDVDAGRLTDSDGETFIATGQLLRQIAREIAPDLSLEEMALVLRKAADLEWAQAGSNVGRKILVSEVHELAAKLQGLSVRLHEIAIYGRGVD